MAEGKRDPVVEIPLEKLDRLLLLLERLAQAQERTLAQSDDDKRRAASRAGPTTAEAEERVAKRHRKLGVW